MNFGIKPIRIARVNMKNYRKQLLGMGAVFIALVFCGFYYCNHFGGHYFSDKDILPEKALHEMPYIKISDEEYLLNDMLFQNTEVLSAINSMDQTVKLNLSLGEKMASEVLPLDVSVSEFVVIGDTVYFTYKIEGYSVIMTFTEDKYVTKTIGVYRKNGDCEYVYKNCNNKTYKKSVAHFCL